MKADGLGADVSGEDRSAKSKIGGPALMILRGRASDSNIGQM